MKEPHTALFIAPTGVGKTHLALSLLETEYRNHFHFIVIICPTLRYNSTYKSRVWVWNDPDVIPIEPGNNLYYLIKKISNLLAGDKTLFLIDDIIADETLDKSCQPLLELAISGRHRGHSLWLLTQSYTAIPNNIRRQAKVLYIWNDPDVIPIEPGNNLYYLIKKISNLLAGDKTLFLIDDIIADETLDKCCQPLLELAISGRHRGHSLWLLTQSYTAIPNNIRRQAKMLYIWYPKNRTDLNTIHEENDVIGPEELATVKAQLKCGKHTCLIMRMEHPRDYMIR